MTNEELAIRIKTGENAAENMLQLWQQNKAFIHMLALKYAGYEEIEDLEQEGFIGLCNAVEGYNSQDGIPFINYAALWIRQAMKRYIENCGSCVRIPSHMHQKMQEYKKLQAGFQSWYGRDPTDWEMKQLLGVTWEMFECMQQGFKMSHTDSLNREMPGQEGQESLTLLDVVASDEDIEGSILDQIEAEELKAVIWPMVNHLPPDQAAVIRMKYQNDQTFKEAGEVIGCTPSAARRTEQKALRELRRYENKSRLQCFLPEAMGSMAYYGNGTEVFNRTWTSSTEKAALWLYE